MGRRERGKGGLRKGSKGGWPKKEKKREGEERVV